MAENSVMAKPDMEKSKAKGVAEAQIWPLISTVRNALTRAFSKR